MCGGEPLRPTQRQIQFGKLRVGGLCLTLKPKKSPQAKLDVSIRSPSFFFLFLVRPYETIVQGAERPVEDGSVVNLLCRTYGARPAAVITWFNGSRPFAEQPAGQVAVQVRPTNSRV